jgi:hypothetical protein
VFEGKIVNVDKSNFKRGVDKALKYFEIFHANK